MRVLFGNTLPPPFPLTWNQTCHHSSTSWFHISLIIASLLSAASVRSKSSLVPPSLQVKRQEGKLWDRQREREVVFPVKQVELLSASVYVFHRPGMRVAEPSQDICREERWEQVICLQRHWWHKRGRKWTASAKNENRGFRTKETQSNSSSECLWNPTVGESIYHLSGTILYKPFYYSLQTCELLSHRLVSSILA